jgi:hypothetical protein
MISVPPGLGIIRFRLGKFYFFQCAKIRKGDSEQIWKEFFFVDSGTGFAPFLTRQGNAPSCAVAQIQNLIFLTLRQVDKEMEIGSF